MPITKSAEKALRSSLKKRSFNNHRKTVMKKNLKEIKALINEGKNEEASKILPKVYKAIDKAAKRGIIKKNTASRSKSKIASKISLGAKK